MAEQSVISAPTQAHKQGYDRAVALLGACSTPDGFLASLTHQDNYRRVWARDGVIIGLAALQTGRQDLIRTFEQTLRTLARYQGPHGEIPSNVDTVTGRVSYGGMTGRVDANLWFVIGCGQYWRATGDDRFLADMIDTIEWVRFLLGAWEFNGRGLLYVPLTGDWADEYVQSGYVLYDQLLYLQAQREITAMHQKGYGSPDPRWDQRRIRLARLIQANYWFPEGQIEPPEDAYHRGLWERGQQASCHCEGEYCQYWMPFFSPQGYGYRFDAFANILASLLDVADEGQREEVDGYISRISGEEMKLIPAFYPVVMPTDRDWEDLQMMFSYSFKNHPFEFHNAGLWPMLTGFYVADLAQRGQAELGRAYLEGIHQANALEVNGDPWGFPEFIHGQRYTAGGTSYQGWSAAAAVMGHHALEGRPPLRFNYH